MLGQKQLRMAASLLLYLGPLLAGMSGMGWTGVPVFALLFALWLVVMHPATWPRDLSLWTGPIVVAAAAQLAVNVLIVVFLFAVGRGLAALEALRLDLSPLFPVALSFLATPLARLFAGAEGAEYSDGPGLHPPGFSGAMRIEAPDLAEDEMLRTLLDLPADADPLLTADALDVALQPPEGAARLRGLEEAIDPLDAGRRSLREAIILWATAPRWREEDSLAGAAETAFYLAGNDPVLLHLFAHRGLDLITAKPGVWTSFPDADEVSARIEATAPENLQAALAALAQAIQAASGDD